MSKMFAGNLEFMDDIQDAMDAKMEKCQKEMKRKMSSKGQMPGGMAGAQQQMGGMGNSMMGYGGMGNSMMGYNSLFSSLYQRSLNLYSSPYQIQSGYRYNTYGLSSR